MLVTKPHKHPTHWTMHVGLCWIESVTSGDALLQRTWFCMCCSSKIPTHFIYVVGEQGMHNYSGISRWISQMCVVCSSELMHWEASPLKAWCWDALCCVTHLESKGWEEFDSSSSQTAVQTLAVEFPLTYSLPLRTPSVWLWFRK